MVEIVVSGTVPYSVAATLLGGDTRGRLIALPDRAGRL